MRRIAALKPLTAGPEGSSSSRTLLHVRGSGPGMQLMVHAGTVQAVNPLAAYANTLGS